MSKSTDHRLTPPDIIEAVCKFARGRIALDVCTEPDNPTNAIAYMTEKALEVDWDRMALDVINKDRNWRRVIWMNHPFSSPIPWVRKACHTRLTDMLVFSGVDFSTTWWDIIDNFATYRCELKKRPKSVDPITGIKYDVLRCGCVWYLPGEYNTNHHDFVSVFSELGRVVPLKTSLF